jgi:hypothetical protein
MCFYNGKCFDIHEVIKFVSFSYMTAIYDNNQHVFVRLGSALGRTSSVGSGSYATIASVQKSGSSPSPYATSDACQVSYYASSKVIPSPQASFLPFL